MNDQQLREALRPLAETLYPREALDAERRVREGFRNDGLIDASVIAGGLPPQRLDWVVQPSAAAEVQVARYQIPGASELRNIAMIATGNVSVTFQADVLVNGVRVAGGSIRVGTSQSRGTLGNVPAPAGSILSIQTLASIPQGVTVSVFYRPVEV